MTRHNLRLYTLACRLTLRAHPIHTPRGWAAWCRWYGRIAMLAGPVGQLDAECQRLVDPTRVGPRMVAPGVWQ